MARGKSYYAVQNGREAGVYNSWDDARQQVDGYSGSVHQRFDSRAEAEAFSRGSGVPVYTDGACTNNQDSSRASAGVGVYYGSGHRDNVSRPVYGAHTNQRAELEAVHDAVETIHSRNDGRNYDIKTDSAYAKNALDSWGNNWQKNDWTTSKNEPVKHRDVIEPTLNRLNELGDRVTISKVKGHSGNPGNDAADALASRGARGY